MSQVLTFFRGLLASELTSMLIPADRVLGLSEVIESRAVSMTPLPRSRPPALDVLVCQQSRLSSPQGTLATRASVSVLLSAASVSGALLSAALAPAA